MKPKLDYIQFELYFKKFNSIPTWTKEKFNERKIMFDFLKLHENIVYHTNKTNIEFNKSVWSYNKSEVSKTKRGHLKKYRGMVVLYFIISSSQYKRELMCFPLL